MAASVILVEKNGAGGTPTTKTSSTVRFKAADNATVDSNNPLVIPAAGAGNYAFSYEKWLRLKIDGTGPSDYINNLKFYTDGSNGFGTGVEVYGRSAAAYSTPAQIATISGLTNIFTYTAAGALALSSGNYSGTGTEIGSHVVLTMRVEGTATVGALAAETLTFSYDEV